MIWKNHETKSLRVGSIGAHLRMIEEQYKKDDAYGYFMRCQDEIFDRYREEGHITDDKVNP